MNLSKTAHIIGGGPSAQRIPFHELSGTLIGVNDSFFNAPCDWCVSMDGRWMAHRWKRLQGQNAKAWLRKDSFDKHVGSGRSWPGLILGECQVWAEGPGIGVECINGNNSGLVALHFAYWEGFKNIFLYGFDMGFDTKKHWYPEYEWSAKGNMMYPAFIKQFETTANRLKLEGIQVLNVSKTSKLPYFEKVDYEQAKDYFS